MGVEDKGWKVAVENRESKKRTGGDNTGKTAGKDIEIKEKMCVTHKRVRAKLKRTKLNRWLMAQLIEQYKKKSLSDDKRRIKKLHCKFLT
ncbi:MAG: hypothetical protein D6780_07540 [Candidatus Dadabacteria bacterium]|nr:MAG: hypothetical protein D6780_07540 [Candidatus Dadabacteria bacterium]